MKFKEKKGHNIVDIKYGKINGEKPARCFYFTTAFLRLTD